MPSKPSTVPLTRMFRRSWRPSGPSSRRCGRRSWGTIHPEPVPVAQLRAALRRLADVYCNDAAQLAHESRSCLLGDGFPVRCAGALMARELRALSAVDRPVAPVLAIVGGATVAARHEVIMGLLDSVDRLILGGAMVWTFLHVRDGMPLGACPYDAEGAPLAREVLEKAEACGVTIIMPPQDFLVCQADGLGARSSGGEVLVMRVRTASQGIPSGHVGTDFGDAAAEANAEAVLQSKAVVWLGCLRMCASAPSDVGTRALVTALVTATSFGATSVLADGAAEEACERHGARGRVTHCVLGEQAAAALLSGRRAPAVDALTLQSDRCSADLAGDAGAARQAPGEGDADPAKLDRRRRGSGVSAGPGTQMSYMVDNSSLQAGTEGMAYRR
ncbi:unnamed protein product, partial [Prorocentrum cordatum]